MKRMLLVMVIAIVTILQVSAQDNNRQMTAQQRTEQRIKLMDEKLNLTDEQKTKIRELYANFNKQKYPVKNVGSYGEIDRRHFTPLDCRTANCIQANDRTSYCGNEERQT